MPSQKAKFIAVCFVIWVLLFPLTGSAAFSPFSDLAFKLEAFIFGPPLLVKHLIAQGVSIMTEKINKKSAKLTDFSEPQDNPRRPDLTSILSIAKGKILSSLLGISVPLDRGPAGSPEGDTSYPYGASRTPSPVIAIRQLAEKQSPIQDTKYSIQDTQKVIVREKEIIREVIVKDGGSTVIVKESAIPPNDEKLSALKTELTDSFVSRINKLVGGFGFNTNRFDDLFVQKSLELAGKLTQPANIASSPITFSSSITSKDISATSLSLSSTLTVSGTATSTISGPLKIAGGLTAGSGNVQIIDSTGKIPALSSSYFAALPSLFSSIGNASSTVQFSASQFQDTLSFEGIGGTTISFDSTTKKITISTTSPTLLNVLNQGADASAFTGTTKLGGLTIDPSGNLTLTGALTISGSATSTLAGPLDIGSGKFTVLSSSGNTAIQGTLAAASSLFQVTSSGFTLLPFGTSTTPSLAFTGDTDTGIFGKDNNILAFGTGGTERLRIDGSGNVGIGTSSPSALLHITATSTPTLILANHTGSGPLMDLQKNGASLLFVANSGNIGIGTTGPGVKLEVMATAGSDTAGDGPIRITTAADTGPAWALRLGGLPSDGDFFIDRRTNAIWSNVLAMDRETGNVGIGTTGPGNLLHLAGSAGASGSIIAQVAAAAGDKSLIQFRKSDGTVANPTIVSSADDIGSIEAVPYSGTAFARTANMIFRVDGTFTSGQAPPTKIQFMTNTAGGTVTERVTIDKSGNVGIGTAGPGTQLTIQRPVLDTSIDNPGANAGLRIIRSGGTDSLQLGAGQIGGAFTTWIQSSHDAGTKDLLIQPNGGNVGIGTTGPGSRLTIGQTTDTNYTTSYNDRYTFTPVRIDNPTTVASPAAVGISFSAGPAGNPGAASIVMVRTGGDASALTFNTVQVGPSFTEKMRITDTGNVGIGTTGPESRVQITGGGLCVGSDVNCNTDNNTEGTVYSAATAMTVYDVAEMYPTTDTTLMPAEVVALDTTKGVFVKRASGSSNERLLGIVSTEPAVLLGGFAGKQFKEEHQVAIALSGRVPARVNTEGGDISIGDPLTASSQQGAVKKATSAGQIIGYALEPFPSPTATSTIQVFVNVGYQGNDLTLGLTTNDQLQTINNPIIDKNGKELSVTQEGDIVVRKIVTLDLEIAKGGKLTIGKDARISTFSGQNQITGKVTIPEGLTYQIVENRLIRPESHIFITLNGTPPEGMDAGVVNIKEEQFTIQLSKGAPYSLTFFYWILDTLNTPTSQATPEPLQTVNASSTSS